MRTQGALWHNIGFWIVVAVVLSGLAVSPSVSKEDDLLERFELFSDVFGKIEDYYVTEVDEEKLFHAALEGMVSSLDPHSQFLDPQLYDELKISTRGEFGGLGISITISTKDHILTIITPLDDTPADRAGLKPGDKIIEIEGESTKDITLEEAVKKLRGPKGSEVTFVIWRSLKDGRSLTRKVTVVRDVIHIKSVEWEMIGDDVAYLRLKEFQGDSGDELSRSLEEAKAGGAKAVILDLRKNPGGLLSAAIDVAEMFVPKGKLIVYTLGRDEQQSRRYLSQAKRQAWDGPLVVLIDQGSASASEIVAGAIQDLDAGLIVGVNSFGKASVQNIYEMSDKSALKLTTAHYYTSSGRQIEGQGIEPDRIVEVEPLDEDVGSEENGIDLADTQIAAALDILRSQLLLGESGLAN